VRDGLVKPSAILLVWIVATAARRQNLHDGSPPKNQFADKRISQIMHCNPTTICSRGLQLLHHCKAYPIEPAASAPHAADLTADHASSVSSSILLQRSLLCSLQTETQMELYSLHRT
jgi:hypothetical protein